MSPALYEQLFASFAFLLGAAIGSFLNVCIYRMPRGLSVNKPRRSFCPHCEAGIPWYHNLPLVSWLFLRGKCARCGAPIAFRYWLVEALTGVLFLAVWLKVSPVAWPLAFPFWILVSLLIVATFIDFEHFIIPDEITWGGAVAGLVLSLALPILHGVTSPLLGGLWGLVGAVAGYVLLRAVVEGGKLAFGRKNLKFDPPGVLRWIRRDQEADLTVGEEQMLWSDFFARGNEELRMQCPEVTIDGDRCENAALRWTLDWVHLGERRWQLEKIGSVVGTVTEVTLPREAMGLGDVKFMACIGAFLGWQAVLFTVMTASVVGAIIGGAGMLLRRREWSVKIPFGPYLALGALTWMFAGPQIVAWYLGMISPR